MSPQPPSPPLPPPPPPQAPPPPRAASTGDVVFSDSTIYAVEGQDDASVYTVSVSPEVQFPVDVVVSLPSGSSSQGLLGLYDSATQSVVGDLSTELVVTLTAANPEFDVAFFPADDGLVEGVHIIDIRHDLVVSDGQDPIPAGTVQMELTDANAYDAGISIMDETLTASVSDISVQEGESVMVPVSLSAPSDQDVTLTISAEDVQRLQLSTNTITFAAGETGPKMIEVNVPDDGTFTDGAVSSLTFTSSSISAPYNGILMTIPVSISEDRKVGMTVRSAQPDETKLDLNESNGNSGTFYVQLDVEPTAPITIQLQDATNSVTFFPDTLDLSTGPSSLESVPVSVLATKIGFSGSISVTAVVSSTGDALYDGLTNSDLTIDIQNTAPAPELVVVSSTAEVQEGSSMTFQIALSSAPANHDVTIAMHPSWIDGIPRDVEINPTIITIPAGSSQQYQEVEVTPLYSQEYTGTSQMSITFSAFSDDPFFSSDSGVGLEPVSALVVVTDIDQVAVCLSSCDPITKYDFVFEETMLEPVETPYEVQDGEVDLEFRLRTEPIGYVDIETDAYLDGGSTSIILPQDSQPEPTRRNNGLTMNFSVASWSSLTRVLLQASLDSGSVTTNPVVVVTGRCSSTLDPFYNGLEFMFTVGVRPAMNGPAVSAKVENFVLPTTVTSTDGVETIFQPLSVPTDSEVSILPVDKTELDCDLESTRFKPFGYKEMAANPPQESLESPAKVYWKIPDRYKSLDQLKFLTLSSKDSCDWTLKDDIELETRAGPDGQLEYWAYTHLDDFSVFALAQVEPLVSEPTIPHIMTYTEGTSGQPISPMLDLTVKKDNGWDSKYPNLRLQSMSIAVTDGYVLGEDLLTVPEVPGFESTWDEEMGVLTLSAVAGFDFTENTADDYEDLAVEQVDVSEILANTPATATLLQFQEVLRMVSFESVSGGSVLTRQMTLSSHELLTSDTIATITLANVVNTPDPPKVIPSTSVMEYTEKAPLTPVDVHVEVFHPDGKKIQKASVWIEPHAEQDVLMYQASPGAPSTVFVNFDSEARQWKLVGIASAEVYSAMLQDMFFRNNGPLVEVNGSPNRTVWFQVEDVHGRKGKASRDITIRQVVDPPKLSDASITGMQDMPVTGTLSASDPEGKPLTFSLGCKPRFGTVEFLDPADGASGGMPFRYIPDDKSFGTDSFLFIADNGEAVNAGLMEINVQNTDDPPVAEEFNIIVYSGRETTFELPAYDPDGSPVEIYILREPQGAKDVLRLANEEVIGTSGQRRKGSNPVTVSFPDVVKEDFAVVFSYVAQDLAGGKVSEEAFAHVLVRSPEYWNSIMKNQAPKALPVTLETDQGQALRGRIDAEDDFDTEDQLRFSVSTPPVLGTVEIHGAEFTYMPERGAYGQDTFIVKVQDGMLAETEVTVTVNVIQNNEKPLMACEDSQGGLFDTAWKSLRALTVPAGRLATSLSDTAEAVAAEAGLAVASDPLKLKARTRALDQVSLDIAEGRILAGTDTSFTMACSSRGSWSLDMVPSMAQHLMGLNVSLLAFDVDEFDGLTYRIAQPPERGILYASKAISSESYLEADYRTFIEIGGSYFQAGSVTRNTTEFLMAKPGQPLYLQYRPSALARGTPVDTLAWQAIDFHGEATATSYIDIDIQCSPGYFFHESDPDFCVPCPAGQYNLPNAQDQTQCIPCPAGAFCEGTASTSFEECPAGSFQEIPGSSECVSCPDQGMHTEPGAMSALDCECPRGTFVFGSSGADEEGQRCQECSSPLQLCDEVHQIVPKPSGLGVWIDPVSGSAHTCEPYIACIQHKTVEAVLEAQCSEGYQGKACSKCAESYYRDDDTMCKKCNNYVWIIYSVGFMAALLLAPTLMNVSRSYGFMSVNIFIGTMQITTQIQRLELEWPEEIRSFFSTLNLLSLSLSALSPRCVVSEWQYLNKVPLTNAAPIGVFVFLLSHQYIVPRMSFVLRTICKFLFPWIMAMPQDPDLSKPVKRPSRISSMSLTGEDEEETKLTDYIRRFFQITPPEDIIVLNLRGSFRRVIPAMLVVLSWTYVGLVNVNLEFFNCRYVDGRYYLSAEPSVECYDFSSWNQHTMLLPVCIAASLIYVIGIPLLFGTLLFRNRKILRHRYGLHMMIEQQELSEHSSHHHSGASTAGASSVLQQLDLNQPAQRLQNSEDLYGFLFRHYEEKRFWWEMLVLMRKFSIAAIVHQPKAPEQQTMLGIICLLIYIALVNGIRPYSSAYLNWMDILGASLATSLTFSGLVMFGGYDTRLDTHTSALIQIVLIMLLVTFLIGYVVFDSIPKLRLQVRLWRQRRRVKRLKRHRSLIKNEIASTATVGAAAVKFKTLLNKKPAATETRLISVKSQQDNQVSIDDEAIISTKTIMATMAKQEGSVAFSDNSNQVVQIDVHSNGPGNERNRRTSMMLSRALTATSNFISLGGSRNSQEGESRNIKSQGSVHLGSDSKGRYARLQAAKNPSGRKVQSLEENVAALRAAVMVMIPPSRVKLLKEMKLYLEQSDYDAMSGWVMSQARTHKDLEEARWVLKLLSRLDGSVLANSTEETTKTVQGVEELIDRIHRQSEGHPRHARRGRRRSSVAFGSVAAVEDDDTAEDNRHVAELLEITGASKINAAVKLQVATMRVKKLANISGLISEAKKAAALEDSPKAEASEDAARGGLATALAAGKLMKRAKAKRNKSLEAAELISNMIFGDLQGPKAGPLRWAIHRKSLLKTWEWKAFHSGPWQVAIIGHLAMRAGDDFADHKIKEWTTTAVIRQHRRDIRNNDRGKQGLFGGRSIRQRPVGKTKHGSFRIDPMGPQDVLVSRRRLHGQVKEFLATSPQSRQTTTEQSNYKPPSMPDQIDSQPVHLSKRITADRLRQASFEVTDLE